MEASPVHIVQYFDGAKQGVIPLFQRPYSWDPKDWRTLWDDLMAQYDEDERGAHFMGAIVTVPVKSVPVGVTKHLVIDGQQRLTTLALLLAAIRDRAAETGDATTQGIIGDLLVNRHYQPPDDLKLVPTQADREAYSALVFGKDLSQHAGSRAIEAYEFFSSKLTGSDAEGRPVVPATTLQAIQQSLLVVMINLSEADDPYLIFESLNHKGKPLTQADLVRNYVLMRFQHSTAPGGEQEKIYEELWRPMEKRLDSSATEFLRHYAMGGGKNVRKGEIYSAAKNEFEKLRSASDVLLKLQDMAVAAQQYHRFLEPSQESNEHLAVRLQRMQELDSTVFYPLLLRLSAGGASAQGTLVNALDALESFHVRRLVCGVPTNALNKITLELCASLPEHDVVPWLFEKLAQGSGGRRWPSDDEFSTALITQHLYPRRRIAKFVLVALEESFGHKEVVDCSDATIEHVMPQTLSHAWHVELGAEYGELHERWCDTIGNLTLTGYNTELSNSPFGEKKEMLKNTHFELSRDIAAQERWGPHEIQTRAKSLAAKALVRWPREQAEM